MGVQREKAMQRITLTLLLFIFLLAGAAAYIDGPQNPGLHRESRHSPLLAATLDLQGGVRVLLEPEQRSSLNKDTPMRYIEATRDQIEQRVNGGLGVEAACPVWRVEAERGGEMSMASIAYAILPIDTKHANSVFR